MSRQKVLVVTPYPDNPCPACERGEQAIVPPHSSIVGSMPVHAPSGNVCSKFISPDHLKLLAGRRKGGKQ